MTNNSDASRPFLPGDLSAHHSLVRAAAAALFASTRNNDAAEILRRSWPADRTALQIIKRAAVDPAVSTTWGTPVTGAAVAEFVAGLAPISGAARLIAAGARVSFLDGGPAKVSLPYLGNDIVPAFVVEGEPIPVLKPLRGHNEVGPVTEIAAIIAYTGELFRSSPQNIESVFNILLREAMARSLDAAVFSAAAADSSRPAGLLYGVTPIPPMPGGDQEALRTDLRALVDAIATAGGGANVWLFCSLGRALTLRLLAGTALDFPVVPVAGLDPGMVIAVDVAGFASGFGDEPEISTADAATLHMDDSAKEIVSGSGPTTAAPVRSLYQTRSKAMRIVLPGAWAMRAPGLVQVVSGVSW